jgi:hypothetical protein
MATKKRKTTAPESYTCGNLRFMQLDAGKCCSLYSVHKYSTALGTLDAEFKEFIPVGPSGNISYHDMGCLQTAASDLSKFFN